MRQRNSNAPVRARLALMRTRNACLALAKIVENGLIDEEVTIAHARHFLPEADRVPLEVVADSLLGAHSFLLVNKVSFVDSGNINLD